MSDLSREIIRHVPFLRRYARALTGTQEEGDRLVKICLGAFLEDLGRLAPNLRIRLQLFKVFHGTLALDCGDTPGRQDVEPSSLLVESHLRQLPSRERQVLLLSKIEGFSANEVGSILDMSELEAVQLLDRAKTDLMQQPRTAALVIEDEPVIAFDISGIVTEMGHRVVGTAATHAEALAIAIDKRPGLILADIQLDDGSSGIDAVKEILDFSDVPVVFVTAYPERLLTGEKAEPAFLVSKPFEPDVLKITIAQALYTKRAEKGGKG